MSETKLEYRGLRCVDCNVDIDIGIEGMSQNPMEELYNHLNKNHRITTEICIGGKWEKMEIKRPGDIR